MEDQNIDTVDKKVLVKRGAVLLCLVVVIGAAWLFFRNNHSVLGIGNTKFGLLKSEMRSDRKYATAVGFYAEPFRLKNTDGKIIDFQKDILGKKTLLVFQASWCVYCKQEKDDLNRIAAEKKINFITIDIKEDETLVKEHLASNGINYPWYLDPEGEVSTWFLLAGTPTHIYLDTEGKIIRRDTGYQNTEQLNEGINQLLAS
jgi:thiol-disulfide isomerase/thioredoxin